MTGESRLTLIRRIGARKSLYQCTCGQVVERRHHDVDRGLTKSCGCLNREQARARFTTHGEIPGKKPTPEWRAWKNMKLRCKAPPGRPDHGKYVARGIKVCDRWRDSFAAFLADMGRKPSPRHSLDRINNDGNYEPGNCRWATPNTQARNRRPSVLIEWHGETLPLADWAQRLGVPYHRLFRRLRSGWTVAEAFTSPRTS